MTLYLDRIRISQRQVSGITLIMLGVFFCLSVNTAKADDWGPWEVADPNLQHRSQTESNPLTQIVSNFQKYISPIDGARCPMYPTCSAYAQQALHKHGPLLGTFMTADRLMHEGDAIEQREIIMKWGFQRYFDPLAYNDFWLGAK